MQEAFLSSQPVTSACNAARHPLFTVGYTSFLAKDGRPSLDAFVNMLHLFRIGSIVDVRSSPYGSAYFREYGKDTLEAFLRRHGIYYQHFGRQFGARPDDPSLYTDGRADFSKMSKTPDFVDGCRRIATSGLSKMSICLMCAEKDPLTCHRTILVANHFRLAFPDIEILHIQQGEGRGKDDMVPEGQNTSARRLFAETQAHADLRLMTEEKVTEPDNEPKQLSLFDQPQTKVLSQEERIQEAYHRRELKIAWKINQKENEEMP